MTQINAGNFIVDTNNPPNYGIFTDGDSSTTSVPLFIRTSNLIGQNDIHLYVTYTNQNDVTAETVDYTVIPGNTGSGVSIPVKVNSDDLVKDVVDARVVSNTGNDNDAFIFLLDDETSVLASNVFNLQSQNQSHQSFISGRSMYSEHISIYNSTATGYMNPQIDQTGNFIKLNYDSNLMNLSGRSISISQLLIDAFLSVSRIGWIDVRSGRTPNGISIYLIGNLLESEVGTPVTGYVKDQSGNIITSDEEMRIYARSTSSGEKNIFVVSANGFYQLFLRPIGYDDVRLVKYFITEGKKFDIAYRLYPDGTILDGNNPPSELQFYYIPILQIEKVRNISISNYISI